MIAIAQPLGFAALAALVLPIIIHLLRRSERNVVTFAALRFLNERRYPRREWELWQPALLALRLLLIATLSALLTMPRLSGHVDDQSPRSAWVAVAPGVDLDAARRMIDLSSAPWHWLSPGFPLLDPSKVPPAIPPSSLIRELDAQLPADTSLTVLVPPQLAGLDAERMRLRSAVRWRIVPGVAAPTENPAGRAPRLLAVRYDPAGAVELPVARALAAAWGATGSSVDVDVATIESPLPGGTDWLLWLGGPLSAQAGEWVRDGGRALASRESALRGDAAVTDAGGATLFRERVEGRGRIVSSANPLEVGVMPELSNPRIAQQLYDALSAPVTAPDRAFAVDVAPARRAGLNAADFTALIPYAALLAAALYFVERLMASRAENGVRAD